MPIAAWIAIGAAALIIIWYISVYNSLVKRRVLYEEAFSGMDIFMKKRFDLIPNLVETVKGYAAHESSTLEAVISARNQAVAAENSGSIENRLASESALSGAISRLLVVAEQYPQLKADSQFLNLSQQLASVETDISQARKYYNGAVRQFNTKIGLFPASIVASLGRFTKQPFFELDDAGERSAPQVSFS
ncbi:MAG: LemA family protein [Oscillospiraceae bacterium]|nr:LemA family protein [Oscillospiraceae bacterium]